MRAIDRTCQLFVRSVAEALPETRINIVRSRNSHGQSRYVYIHLAGRIRPVKVRISDHPVGMRRAMSGDCQLFLSAGATPASWAVWLAELAKGERRD